VKMRFPISQPRYSSLIAPNRDLPTPAPIHRRRPFRYVNEKVTLSAVRIFLARHFPETPDAGLRNRAGFPPVLSNARGAPSRTPREKALSRRWRARAR